MSKLALSYNIVNYTPASASPVDSNFDTLEQHINGELIERDGTVAMQAQLKLIGDPVADLDAAPKQYVDQVLPIGIVMMYGGAGAPPGGRWAVCNGAEMQTSAYPALYGVIGHNFSEGGTPGSRFNLPNLQDRMPMGKGVNTAMGETGGRRDTVLLRHSHGMSQHTHPINHDHGSITTSSSGVFSDPPWVQKGSSNYSINTVNGSTALGGPGAHTHTVDLPMTAGKKSLGPDNNTTSESGQADTVGDNLPPFLGVQYIIRVV